MSKTIDAVLKAGTVATLVQFDDDGNMMTISETLLADEEFQDTIETLVGDATDPTDMANSITVLVEDEGFETSVFKSGQHINPDLAEWSVLDD